ncbi:Ohr subfamily peroxiredoxin [Croceivirga radicis]|uniref:Ohr subfamily peroxiredoxin n=1 Tax=Croceivirga radicis TaxID=1929488 RepID=A0A1V6LQB3_9FLAO|nr:Ohr family peroxiredoxin [Croceivirga radicis]OQD42373.1 Ohr subfamily peroxiredoxin [Croceivirga radicis]
MKTIFETFATNEGGRAGHVVSDNGAIDLDIRMPNAKGEQEAGTTNPEQLFAAAYASCYAGAVQAVAGQQGHKDLGDFIVKSTVSLNKDEDGFFIEVILDTYLPTLSKEQGEEVVNLAHEMCPYSKATRDNITVHLNLLMDE